MDEDEDVMMTDEEVVTSAERPSVGVFESVMTETLKSDIEVMECHIDSLACDAGAVDDMKTVPVVVDQVRSASTRSRSVRHLLKYVSSVPLLLMLLVFGALYLFSDDLITYLDQFGLVISPQMRYVRGTPPV